MPKEMKFALNFSSNADKVLGEFVKGIKEAKKQAESTSISTGRGPVPRAWKSGLLPGGMSPSELYIGGMGSVASGVLRAPSGTSGSTSGMSSIGMGALSVAGGILLVKAIKEMTVQSKIIGGFLKTLSSILGLALDLILIPFLPILVYALLALIPIILALNKLLTPAIQTALGGPTSEGGKAGKDMATPEGWPIDIPSLAGLIASVLIGAVVAALLVAIGVSLGWALVAGAIVAIVTGLIVYWLINAAYDAGDAFMAAIRIWWTNVTAGLTKAWTDAMAGLEEFKNFLIGFITIGWLQPWIDAFWAGLQGWLDAFGTIPELLNQALLAIQSGAKAIANAFIGLINWILDSVRSVPILGAVVPADLPYLDTGGFVKETGVAVVHKGETVTPAGASSSGNTYNFYGYDDKSLQSKVKSIIRQEGTRYML